MCRKRFFLHSFLTFLPFYFSTSCDAIEKNTKFPVIIHSVFLCAVCRSISFQVSPSGIFQRNSSLLLISLLIIHYHFILNTFQLPVEYRVYIQVKSMRKTE